MKFDITFMKDDEAPFFSVEMKATKSRDDDPTPNLFHKSPNGDDYVSLGPYPQNDESDPYGEPTISRCFWNLEDAEQWVDHLIGEARQAIETWRAIKVPENRTIEI